MVSRENVNSMKILTTNMDHFVILDNTLDDEPTDKWFSIGNNCLHLELIAWLCANISSIQRWGNLLRHRLYLVRNYEKMHLAFDDNQLCQTGGQEMAEITK